MKTPIRLTGIAKNINRVRLFCLCSLVWMLTETQRHPVFGHWGHNWWRYSISTLSELVLTSTFLSYINKFTCNFLLQAFLCSHHHMDSISSKYNINYMNPIQSIQHNSEKLYRSQHHHIMQWSDKQSQRKTLFNTRYFLFINILSLLLIQSLLMINHFM